MSDITLREVVEFRLKNKAESLTPPVPVVFENTKAERPNNGAYIAYDILAGDSRRANLGGKRTKRSVGILQIDCFYPKNTGMGRVQQLADTFDKLWDEFNTVLPDGSVTFSVPKQTKRGEAGEHVCVTVSVAYRMDTHVKVSH